MVLIYDEYRRANAETMRQVFAFLGVDDTIDIDPRDVNPSGVRSLHAAAAWGYMRDASSPMVDVLRRAIRSTTSRHMRYRVRRLYHRINTASPPPVDDELMAALRQRFAPEVQKVSEYLGRDLCSLWGYPAT
jgi:hypothetical protein